METGTIAARLLRLSLPAAALLGCLAAAPAQAALLFQRDLPAININAPGANRSNVDCYFSPPRSSPATISPCLRCPPARQTG